MDDFKNNLFSIYEYYDNNFMLLLIKLVFIILEIIV